MKKLFRGVVLGLMVTAVGACSGTGSSPTSPSAAPGLTSTSSGSGTNNVEGAGAGSAVGVSGLVRDLDMASRSFNLLLTSSTTTYARGDSRVVRADDSTQLTVKGSPARFAALANGMTLSVRGVDQGRFILAQSIVAR